MRARFGAGSALTASLCLVLAFTLTGSGQQVPAAASAANQQQPPTAELGSSQEAGHLPSGPMMSMGSESAAALESSAALADDLIAAESSQSPDAAEHKSFTASAPIRQDIGQQQQPPQPAPVYAGPQQQQAQQMFHQQQQQQQHMAMRMAHPQQHQPHHHLLPGAQKPFHPAFMAAALAGNYGPAQQQLAQQQMASLQAAHQQQSRHPVHQQQQQQMAHQQQMMQQPQHMHHQQQHHQQQLHPGRPQMVQQAAGQQEPAAPMAVQESTVRQNVVPAPSFSQPSLDSNSIELNDMPSSVSPAASQSSARPSEQTGLAVAGSAQHPVIAPAGSSSIVHDSAAQAANSWPLQAPDIPKIVSLEVKCEKNLMKVSIEFDKIFNGVIFSKGHYSQGQCLHVGSNSGKQQAYFDISINSCGTQGNTQNGLYGMGGNTGSGTFFENTIVIQYDPNVQEVYDHARKLRCTWHDQYEKAVTFRPFPVDMLDIVRADFAGDNVGCWMQIQVGRGPWASEVAGIVKIGQTMTMVLAIKDEENKFDMLVRNCFAHDGKRGPIELVDKSGCITRPKLMSRFTKIKNFGSSATVLSYAHFQAFKFPDSMEVHFQCTIQICRHQCPEQCSSGNPLPGATGSGAIGGESYSESTISGTFNINGGASSQAAGAADSAVHLRKFGSALSRERRDLNQQEAQEWQLPNNRSHHHHHHQRSFAVKPMIQNVGLNRMIQVVSAGDLAFAIQQQQQQLQSNGSNQLDAAEASQLTRVDMVGSQICMSSYNFVLSLVILVLILLCSCLLAIGLYLRQKSFAKCSNKLSSSSSAKSSLFSSSSSSNSTCSSSPSSTMRPHVPSKPTQLYTDSHHYHHQLRANYP